MSESVPSADGRRVPDWLPAACVLAAIAFTTLVRLRLAATPLERDEGEYAYSGALLLDGTPPYRAAWNMKFPGTYYAYAAILAVFGRSAWAVHAGLAVVNAGATWLVFRAGSRLLGAFAGVVAAAAFGLMTLDRWILGVWGHATHFVALAVVAGFVALLRACESRRAAALVGAGALFGVAVVMKQHAVFFVPFAAAVASQGGRRGRDALLVCAGAAIPLAVVVALAAAQGTLDRFWWWTIQYASAYVSDTPASHAAGNFAAGFGTVLRATGLLWIAAGFGFVALFTERRHAPHRWLVGGLALASAFAVCPGFYFRSHYFLVLAPAAALGVGLTALWIEARTSRVVAACVVAALAAQYAVAERDYLFAMTPTEVSRARFGLNPFVEAPEIGRRIRETTGADARVAVFGSEPEILFHAGRRGASGYLYTYPLMEPQPYAPRMQDEFIAETEAADPEYVVSVEIDTSWLVRPESDRRVLAWTERFLAERYELVGVADAAAGRVLWDDEARSHVPGPQPLVRTYRRRR